MDWVHSREVLEVGYNLYLALWMYLYVFVSFEVHRHSSKKLVRVWFKSTSEAIEATRTFQKSVCKGASLMNPDGPVPKMTTELEAVRNFFEDTGHAEFFELDIGPSTSSSAQKSVSSTSRDPYLYIDVVVGNPNTDNNKNALSCCREVPTIGTALSQVIQLAHGDGVLNSGNGIFVFKGAYLYTDGNSESEPWLAQMSFKPQDPSEARAKREKEQPQKQEEEETANKMKKQQQQQLRARFYKTGLIPSGYNDRYKGRVAV